MYTVVFLPDSCRVSRMLRIEAILSAVAGLTISWSSNFSREPSSVRSRSITTADHTKYKGTFHMGLQSDKKYSLALSTIMSLWESKICSTWEKYLHYYTKCI